MSWVLAIVLAIEIGFLGFILYELDAWASRLSEAILDAEKYINDTEAKINIQINSAKQYIAALEKRINDKFGSWL